MQSLISRLNRQPRLTLELLAASLLINVLALAAPLFFILVFNRYLTGGVDGTLITLTVGMIIAIGIQYGFRVIRARMAGEMGLQPDAPQVQALFGTLIHSRLAALRRVPESHLIQAVQKVHLLHSAYGASNVTAVLDMPFSFLFIAIIFLISPQLGLITVAGAVLTVLSAGLTLRALKAPAAYLQQVSTDNQMLLQTLLQTPETVRAFNAPALLTPRWSRHIRELFTLRRFTGYSEDIAQFRLAAIGLLTRTLVIALGARQVAAGELTIGAIIGISILASLPLTALARFMRALTVLTQATQAETTLHELAGLPREPLSGTALKQYAGGLALKGLAFVHADSRVPLFESLNVTLPAGSVLGITGPSGAGKSTLARLLVGLLTPTRGQILADGVDISQMSLEWWRRQIMYLPQEPTFLRASIATNLSISAPELNNATLNQVLSAAGMRRFLDAHPKGLELMLSETGAPLPPGMRRQLALARALTTEGQLVILDDPVEGLDAEGWRIIKTIITQLAQAGKTILIFSGDPRIFEGVNTVLDLGRKPVPVLMSKKLKGQS